MAMANVGAKKRGTKLISAPGFTHDKQPQGRSVGAGQKKAVTDRPGQLPGNVGGKKNTVHTSPMANVDKQKGALISKPGFTHEGQTQGHGIGTGQKVANLNHSGKTMAYVGGSALPHGGEKHIFGGHPAVGADGFGHAKSNCCGPYERLSGHSGAHRLGKK